MPFLYAFLNLFNEWISSNCLAQEGATSWGASCAYCLDTLHNAAGHHQVLACPWGVMVVALIPGGLVQVTKGPNPNSLLQEATCTGWSVASPVIGNGQGDLKLG